jgi:hypothetical protein
MIDCNVTRSFVAFLERLLRSNSSLVYEKLTKVYSKKDFDEVLQTYELLRFMGSSKVEYVNNLTYYGLTNNIVSKRFL